MQYRRLGRSGLKVSELSFGSWVTFANQVDIEAAASCMQLAFDAGVNFFDNAETYAQGRSEEVMGAALKRLGWRRDSYLVSSKVFFGSVADPRPTQCGLSRKHVIEACDQALTRLGLDYLDLYFCHRPDAETPIEETVRAMHDLVQSGKVLYWGTSEWSAAELFEACRIADERKLIGPTMEQPQYNLFWRQRFEVEYEPVFEQLGLGSTIWSPTASGVLTGKYSKGIPERSRMNLKGYEWLRKMVESDEGRRKIEAADRVVAMANELGVTASQLAIAWCLKNRHVSTVILGASNVDQLGENLDAVRAVERLDDEAAQALAATCHVAGAD